MDRGGLHCGHGRNGAARKKRTPCVLHCCALLAPALGSLPIPRCPGLSGIGAGMYGLADEEMEDAPGPSGRSAPSGGGDVWAGWVPAVKEEPTAAELKEKIKAKARAQG